MNTDEIKNESFFNPHKPPTGALYYFSNPLDGGFYSCGKLGGFSNQKTEFFCFKMGNRNFLSFFTNF